MFQKSLSDQPVLQDHPDRFRAAKGGAPFAAKSTYRSRKASRAKS